MSCRHIFASKYSLPARIDREKMVAETLTPAPPGGNQTEMGQGAVVRNRLISCSDHNRVLCNRMV